MQKTKPSLINIEILFVSFFGVGFIPVAPGTFGSLATLPFLYAMAYFQIPLFLLLIPFLLLTFASCMVCEFVQKKHKIHDPKWIVIDEVLGMSLTFFFHPTTQFIKILLAFALFRFFDIVKIWPASYFDKKVTHGLGTVVDDLVSGVYAGILYYFLQKLLPH